MLAILNLVLETTHRYHNICYRFQRYQQDKILPDLIMLHGFLGSEKQFFHLLPELLQNFNPVLVEINAIHPGSRGNLRRPVFNAHDLAKGLDQALATQTSPDRWVLGYSMGGRLALTWAVNYPGKARALILESSTPGISSSLERTRRQKLDNIRAKMIREDFPGFLQDWERQKIFQTGKSRPQTAGTLDFCSAAGKSEWYRSALQKKPEEMAWWLEDFGSGIMPSLWGDLKALNGPVVLITGEYDLKFCRIAQKMLALLPRGQHVIVPDAAHRVHLDAPGSYAGILRKLAQQSG